MKIKCWVDSCRKQMQMPMQKPAKKCWSNNNQHASASASAFFLLICTVYAYYVAKMSKIAITRFGGQVRLPKCNGGQVRCFRGRELTWCQRISIQVLAQSGNLDCVQRKKGNFEEFFLHKNNFLGQRSNFAKRILTFPENYGYKESFEIFWDPLSPVL